MINYSQHSPLPFVTTGAICYWAATYVYSCQQVAPSYINATYQIENQDKAGIK